MFEITLRLKGQHSEHTNSKDTRKLQFVQFTRAVQATASFHSPKSTLLLRVKQAAEV